MRTRSDINMLEPINGDDLYSDLVTPVFTADARI